MSSVKAYLAKYATPEIHLAEALTSSYSHVVAIPCVDERPTFVEGVSRAAKSVSGRILVIIVVNARAAAGESVHEANRVLIEELKSMGRRQGAAARVSSSPPAWICDLEDLDLLVVDRSSDGFHLPEGQGVGLARRIGCDLALALYARGQVASRWLFMTDADVEVSSNYFRAAKAYEGAALAYPFWHETDDSDQGKALSLYELSLRYYVLGLHWAGSSYAFQTVGSTIAVDYEAYAAVRGMPKREAAEDFYLLNKIAKQGPVVRPRLDPIRIAQRTSTRVPFGTGAATGKISNQLREGREFCMYCSESFSLLRDVLEALEDGISKGELELSAELEDIAQSLGLVKAFALARDQTRTTRAMRRRIVDWFDAFRTLKFVHALRDREMPIVPWRQAVERASFLPDCDGSEPIAELRQHLFELEETRLPR